MSGKLTPSECGKLGGRPTIRTPELVEELLEWLAAGKTIRTFCQEKKTISRALIYAWAKQDSELSRQLARAKEIGASEIEDEIMEIADTRNMADDQDVPHRKLRIWAREKRLIWNNRAKYGNQVQVDKRVEHTVVLTDMERMVRLKQLMAKAQAGPEVTVEIGESTDDEE